MSEDGDHAIKPKVRAALGEALSLARLAGDTANEQAALSALVNLAGEPAGGGSAGGEARTEARDLQQLLARTGRSADNDGCCAVCLEPLNMGDGDEELHVLRCGHVFHRACSMRWAEHSRACPQCQGPMFENG